MAEKPDYYDDFGYGLMKHERLLRKEANKAAWAEAYERRHRLQAFAAQTRRNRWKQHLPKGGSLLWSKVSEWATRRGLDAEARKWREHFMPHWQAGDAIPVAIVRDIIRECMRARGERKLKRLGLR